MSDKPNCYECVLRSSVPGSAHSQCRHPEAEKTKEAGGAMTELLAIIGGAMPLVGGPLKIGANPHGIRCGWFSWPYNFDPVWLTQCEGFEAKEKDQ
jgi:hypothetical protein